MRMMPHDQNSGGFFVALLKKHDSFEWKYATGNKAKTADAEEKQ